MTDLKQLENQQLGLYYEKIDRELNIVQTEILKQLQDIFNDIPYINSSTYNNPKKFKNFCSPYRNVIRDKYKKDFIEIIQQREKIEKEIKFRQKKMLQEIGITIPSILTETIVNWLGWNQLPVFEQLIKFIKLAQQWKWHTRPKEKKIYIPEELRNKFNGIEWILTIVGKNLWPTPN